MNGPAQAHGVERDLSLEAAARQLGHSPRHLRAVWSEIPTAYTTPGGRYWVNPDGLRQWLFQRSRESTQDAAGATATSSAR